MTFSAARARHYLQQGDLRTLFIEELGWDRHSGTFSVEVDGATFALHAIAQKSGVQVLACAPASDGGVPTYDTRRKIERQVTKLAYEHLIIFIDAANSTQVWQWILRQPGQPAACREQHFDPLQSGEALVQKLRTIQFTLSDEEGMDVFLVARRLRDAFDRDKVTKRFYERFRAEHRRFLEFIQGIAAQGDREWYASLMLNRLMFVYFIQQKGFLSGDQRYLQNRLAQLQERHGPGHFLTFYRFFLLRLFHEGFGQPATDRLPDLHELLGDVPYLNGGLFESHQLERENPEIDIPDEAFERLFAFFDEWQWHLDDRPLGDREINPDVLGYIFEQFINRKQMGAYYTKEDITGYISKSTIVPHLFDVAARECAIALAPGSAVWRLLQESPDRYVYEPVRRGVVDATGAAIPESTLPHFVQVGMHDARARMHDRRYNLGEADLRDNRDLNRRLTLPTETWREYVQRRQRCLDLRERMAAGEVHVINDLVTYNLDLRQFAQDVIEECEGPELLRACWKGVTGVRVLDPTCGSGAFLFAALNVLEPLYEACLDRMQAFVDDLDRSGEPHSPRKFDDFRRALTDVAKHPNRRYYILKSVIVNNLYGVDIMEEAVEICKLRLFLKLVAQVEQVRDIEPLPDIDFNIRTGNTLVGFVNRGEVRRSAERAPTDKAGVTQARMMDSATDEALRRLEEEAEVVDRASDRFHEMQTEQGMDSREFAAAKLDLRNRLRTLSGELDRYLARDYGIDPDNAAAFAAWRASHQPFHWFAEFYGIMRRGGFDGIIGNPPYVERSRLGDQYRILRYRTETCRDIYAWFVERSFALRQRIGRIGLIVPVSLASSRNFGVLREIVRQESNALWLAHFSNRPGQLFEGAQNRLTIMISDARVGSRTAMSTRYHKWFAREGERGHLFATLRYVPSAQARDPDQLFPKAGAPEAVVLVQKAEGERMLGWFLGGNADLALFWVRVPGYFCQFFLHPPQARPVSGGPARTRGEVISIALQNMSYQRLAHAALNSTTYYCFHAITTDGRHINPSDVKEFGIDLERLAAGTGSALDALSQQLDAEFATHTCHWRKSGLLIDSVDSRQFKSLLDQIDHLLAHHYGFTDEELDFIINYDIKYRMGQDAAVVVDVDDGGKVNHDAR